MAAYDIPFNRPTLVGREDEFLAEARGHHAYSRNGPFGKRCEAKLESLLGAQRVLLTGSCTAGLELSMLLLDLQPGDEVIIPSYTFVSAANAICLRGAVPKFVDIRADTLNMDEALWEEAITERTKAVMPMHYAGVGCEMSRIVPAARRHGLTVIEDAAQCLGASYEGKPLGTFSAMATFSFHETKNVFCGEGGALAVHDTDLIDRAQMMHDNGTNRHAFFAGKVDKYSWVELGSSFGLSDLAASFLLAQLEALDTVTRRRKEIYEFYRAALQPLADHGLLTLPTVPPQCNPNGHIFYILTSDEAERDQLIGHLRMAGIQAVFHYVPLHLAPMGEKLGYRAGMLPITEDLPARLLRLPMFFGLRDEEVEQVAAEIFAFYRVSR